MVSRLPPGKGQRSCDWLLRDTPNGSSRRLGLGYFASPGFNWSERGSSLTFQKDKKETRKESFYLFGPGQGVSLFSESFWGERFRCCGEIIRHGRLVG